MSNMNVDLHVHPTGTQEEINARSGILPDEFVKADVQNSGGGCTVVKIHACGDTSLSTIRLFFHGDNAKEAEKISKDFANKILLSIHSVWAETNAESD